MNITNVKDFLEYFIKNTRARDELEKNGFIQGNDYSNFFYSIDKHEYYVDATLSDNPYYIKDGYCIGFTFDDISPDAPINFYALYYNKKDNILKLGFTRDSDEDVVFNCNTWLEHDSFFQSTLIHNFMTTDLEYWKTCIELLNVIYNEQIKQKWQ